MISKIDSEVTARELLRTAKVVVDPETFTLVSLTRESFADLLRSSEISPGGTAPYMILWDRHEVTLMLAQADFAAVKNSISGTTIESGFRLLTFDVVMEFSQVGFLAEVSRILAVDGISIFTVSAYSRDHLLIKQDELATAMRVLGDHVADLC